MVYTPTGDPNINTLGAVPVFDGENPCAFTAKAIQTVSGGQFVMSSGTIGNLFGSGANTWTAGSSILVCPALLYDNVCGIALNNQASGTNNMVGVARKGTFLVQATGAVSGGYPIVFNSGGIVNLNDEAVSGTSASMVWGFSIGRALASADSGGYALIALDL